MKLIENITEKRYYLMNVFNRLPREQNCDLNVVTVIRRCFVASD